MKLTFTILTILLLSIQSSYGQTNKDSIRIAKRSLGIACYHQGEIQTPKQLLTLTEGNTAAYKEMKIARRHYSVANVFGMAGGFIVGWNLGTVLGGGQVDPKVILIGVAVICFSIPFNAAYNNHAVKAVGLYNQDIQQTGFKPVSYNFGFTSNGIGLTMNF